MQFYWYQKGQKVEEDQNSLTRGNVVQNMILVKQKFENKFETHLETLKAPWTIWNTLNKFIVDPPQTAWPTDKYADIYTIELLS